VVVVVALVAGGIVFLGGEEAAASEVILEPAAANGSDPFFDSIATSEVEVAGGGLEEVAGSQGAVESLGGDTPGLYGGTGEDAVCDPDALVAFLEENKAKAKAFAEPLGIAPRAVSDYVAGLTPVVLREDTRVTNHGFKDGRATPVQSVLQAGTAVLVDDLGVPRVRCACGNPLAEPTAIEGTLAYSGDSWDGFDDARLVAVAPASEELSEFELVDVNTGERNTVPLGGGVELVLAPDGLGVVAFGEAGDHVEAVLSELLGEPTDVMLCDYRSPSSGCAANDPQGEFITWEGLTIYINSRTDSFEHYRRGGGYDPETYEYLPLSYPPAATPEGISVGSTNDHLFGAYAGLQSYDCDYGTYEVTVTPATPGTDGLLITAMDGYGFSVGQGEVTEISHGIDDRILRQGCGP
jgi:hypothetical protein